MNFYISNRLFGVDIDVEVIALESLDGNLLLRREDGGIAIACKEHELPH